jgi:hypothetical protein
MIDLIAQALYEILSFMISALPASQGIPDDAFNQIQGLFTDALGLNWLLPVEELFIAMGIVISYEIALFSVKATMYFTQLARGN